RRDGRHVHGCAGPPGCSGPGGREDGGGVLRALSRRVGPGQAWIWGSLARSLAGLARRVQWPGDMATHIPRDQWSEFLDGLGLEHEGWVVAVERIDAPLEQASDEEPAWSLELHESTLDSVEVDVDEGEARLIVTFLDNDPLRVENLVRVQYDEVEEQDGKIVDLETRQGPIIRLWL